VLQAAVDLADRSGIAAVTMRGVAADVGVEAMSLYNHVDNKEDVLDGMIDLVMVELLEVVDVHDKESSGQGWKPSMRKRILGARSVMLRHPWAPSVFETRTNMSPNILKYFDDLFGVFRNGGFSLDLAHHAMHALGSRALGFSQELFVQKDDDDVDPEMAAMMMQQMAKNYPNIGALLELEIHKDPDSTLGWCDDQTEFEFALDLLLDGLDRQRDDA